MITTNHSLAGHQKIQQGYEYKDGFSFINNWKQNYNKCFSLILKFVK
jgi:hypothetical protein